MKKKQLFLIIMMIILIIPNTIFAFADELIDNPKPWVPEDISTMGSVFLGVVQWAGYAIAVGMLLYIAIKYMLSAANEKASLKQSLINYLIGAVIVFGVTTIFTAIVNFFTGDQISYDGPKLSYEEYVAEYGEEGMDPSELAEAYKEYSQKYDEINSEKGDIGEEQDEPPKVTNITGAEAIFYINTLEELDEIDPCTKYNKHLVMQNRLDYTCSCGFKISSLALINLINSTGIGGSFNNVTTPETTSTGNNTETGGANYSTPNGKPINSHVQNQIY